MKIKMEVKKRLENFLSCFFDHEKEFGGYFFKNRRGVIADFIILPNQSLTPKTSCLLPNGSWALAEKMARSRKMVAEAFWHNHPTPCIMSAADTCYAQSKTNIFFVTITPINEYSKEYVWYACRGMKPEQIIFV